MRFPRVSLSFAVVWGLGCGSSGESGAPTGRDGALSPTDASIVDATDGLTTGDAASNPAGDTGTVDGPSGDVASERMAPPRGDGGTSNDAASPRGRTFPDTYATVAILADQLP